MQTFVRALRVFFVLLMGGTAVMIALIQSGLFDPKPVGKWAAERPLSPQTIPAYMQQRFWLDETLPTNAASLRLTAALQEGEADSAYGLLLGSKNDHLAVAVSPLGYLSVWQVTENETNVMLPWQTWPHVRRGGEPNEIWLDVAENGRLTIRINREWLWSGDVETPVGQVGVVGESFGETAVVDFQKLDRTE
ncbi:MAG: hypothetical protein R6X34_09080 [Chloroflexota bacterium]